MTKSTAITELYALFGAPHNADINLARLNKLLDELMAQPAAAHITWNSDGVRTVNGVPDYTPPAAQRTWVGLTPEETDDIIANAIDKVDALIQTADKLKDKNT